MPKPSTSSPRSTRSTRSTAPPVEEKTPKTDTPITPDDTVRRLSFPLKSDGTIDTESLRSSTKESLRVALLDPKLAESLGVSAPASSEATKLIAQMASGLYDGLSFISIALAQRAGYTTQQAAVLAFTQAEKDMLAEPTAKVVDKYFPDLGGKYRDELMLALALGNIIVAKVILLRSGAVLQPDGTIAIPRSTVALATPPATPVEQQPA